MAFQVSPGVQVTEKDLTNVVPAVATSIAGIVMAAEMGPTDAIVAIASENELVQIFGEPKAASNQFEDWLCAAAFLGYGNALRVVRPASAAVNAVSANTAILIKNNSHWKDGDGTTGPYNGGEASVGQWAARSAGAWGNNLKVAMCPSASEFEQEFVGGTENTLGIVETAAVAGATTVVIDLNASGTGSSAGEGGASYNVGDIIHFYETDGSEYKVTAISTDTLTFERYGSANTAGGLKSAISDTTGVRRRWEYYDQFDAAPGTSAYVQDRSGVLTADEMHIAVVDEDGGISGTPKEILEKYANVSKLTDARTAEGAQNYYKDVIFNSSEYIYWMDHPAVATGYNNDILTQGTTLFSVLSEVITSISLTGGTDDYALTAGEIKDGIDRFKDTETVDLNLFICGKADATKAGAAMDMCTDRKDAVAFVSPELSDVVAVANEMTQTSRVKEFFDSLTSTSYAMFDSGYKYTYDKYADTYRWIPLNGDMAGLCARTDLVADAWWSPGGFNRGQIRGAVKIAYNPQKANRDILYRARINPIVAFPGQGTILFGDKTAQSKPSAFDRINVRRLFIVLEKAISTAAKFQLFEFNDEFTRAGFVNMVEPFLRNVQGRRGMTDFLVVCDETNNPGFVVDRNEFVADIFVKPARSINFISLNFVATKTGVAFSEVAGA